MTYPLGSFPRFGHQQRWADERRSRAILNSILTRQAQAEEHFINEVALYEIFCELLRGCTPTDPDGARLIAENVGKLESIRRKHEAGRRAYYGVFGDIFRWFCEASGTNLEYKELGREDMKYALESLARRHLNGEKVIQYTNRKTG